MDLKTAIQSADTLSQAIKSLQDAGFKTNFIANEDCVLCTETKDQYQPEDLKVVASCRFEGQSNPADSTDLLALEAKDGARGTLVLSHSADHSHDADVIKKIPFAENVIRG